MSTELETAPRTVRVAYLVAGFFFLGVVGLWGLFESSTVAWSNARYLWPGLLVAAGGLGLVASFVASRRRQGPSA